MTVGHVCEPVFVAYVAAPGYGVSGECSCGRGFWSRGSCLGDYDWTAYDEMDSVPELTLADVI